MTHITICICTFKRPELLSRTLVGIPRLDTGGRFSVSVVVADNDRSESARATVEAFGRDSGVPTMYCVEPEQNIALARNRALSHASGDFVAFIDDDEFPEPGWLLTALDACDEGVAGVLGPVRPHFDETPPGWLIRGHLCDRPEFPTGTTLGWRQTRTGNVLLRRSVFQGADAFRKEFGGGGEDQDFFRRMMERGNRFIWCNEAVVYEIVPPERRTRSYFWKRALLRGQNEKLLLSAKSIAKSTAAVAGYLVVLPVAAATGQHHFMNYSIRLLDHAGKLMAAVGISPVRGKYLYE